MDNSAAAGPDTDYLVELTAEVVSAYVSHNSLSTADLSKVIADVHLSFQSLTGVTEAIVEQPTPAVSIRKSITPDYLVCLDDGKRFKALKRHLGSLGMTPDQYRAKWGLPADYPMVAPNYSATRSSLALKIGLGKKRPVAVAKPKRRAKAS